MVKSAVVTAVTPVGVTAVMLAIVALAEENSSTATPKTRLQITVDSRPFAPDVNFREGPYKSNDYTNRTESTTAPGADSSKQGEFVGNV